MVVELRAAVLIDGKAPPTAIDSGDQYSCDQYDECDELDDSFVVLVGAQGPVKLRFTPTSGSDISVYDDDSGEEVDEGQAGAPEIVTLEPGERCIIYASSDASSSR